MTKNFSNSKKGEKKFSNLPQIAALIPNGVFTIKNLTSGTHRSFKIQTQELTSDFFPGSRLLSLLTGSEPSHYRSWSSLGTLQADHTCRVFRKHEGTKFEALAAFACKALCDLTAGKVPGGIEVLGTKNCLRCNRMLTVPSSLHQGYGPECIGHVQGLTTLAQGQEEEGETPDFDPAGIADAQTDREERENLEAALQALLTPAPKTASQPYGDSWIPQPQTSRWQDPLPSQEALDDFDLF